MAAPAAQPDRPVLVYDADCGFCRRCVARWRDRTGDRVEYVASRETRAAVELLMPDGDNRDGAEAVFEALRHAPGEGWKLWAYRRVPGVGPLARRVYQFVADHRRGFSSLTTLLSGRDPSPPTFALGAWLFLRGLGVIFGIAFVSLWVQVDGLVGSSGIMPVAEFLAAASEQLGAERYWRLPTLCWIDSGDAFLHGLCAAGVVLSVLLAAGLAPMPVLALLWLVYLSLSVAGQTFLSFQWDILLLEAGFTGLFLAALRPWPAGPSRRRPPAGGLWLVRLLLFKLMFLSGVTKLLSGDPVWRDLTALPVHYQTQPLPTWIGWYAFQGPAWFHHASVVSMYVIEIGLPFLVFGPRRVRHLAGLGLVLFQILIASTGNYCFFNALTVLLCVPLFDDRFLTRLAPRRFAGRFDGLPRWSCGRPARVAMLAAVTIVSITSGLTLLREMVRTQRRNQLPGVVVFALEMSDRLVLTPASPLLRLADPLRTISGYGLFRVMTTTRPEIIVEGSDDGVTWRAYEFRWKPGAPDRRPRFVAPHQPRLDWQMWFAALHPQGHAWWLQRLTERLLAGSAEVLDLIGENPFPDRPPRFVRMTYYRYRFTDPATRARTGAWWERELIGVIMPPTSLQGLSDPSSQTRPDRA